jgi:ABC-type multidrug transport system fused ATPase/permease subunit
MDADKIIALDAGNMVEFDTPSNLLKKDSRYLKSLVDESGDELHCMRWLRRHLDASQ